MFGVMGMYVFHLIVLLIMIIAGYMIKSQIVNIIKNSSSMNSEQIQSGIKITNIIYFTLVIIIVLIIAIPFILRI
ncbi:hypothetical protein SAMN05421734_102359 [Pelagirhabdus alkalitolerans]|uniref:Uncharacterized protein n=1 Tax=Pelagirhabdus alkalitolerans TaxID=1612202 RepID=A0A1G6H8L9_9BACI|nr:hypothetical protein SAMN05421734_102359 [Pelagirhabdus alkalitolerans]